MCTGVADSAILHPQVLHAQLLPQALCPEQVAVPLKHALDEVILDLLHHHAPPSEMKTSALPHEDEHRHALHNAAVNRWRCATVHMEELLACDDPAWLLTGT